LAVLMITIHTALYILNTTKVTVNAGLYPYRKYAYTVWVILPLVMASLAFINPKGAYISQTTHCYLRMRPYGYRIALSWAPRYIIFLTIIVVYGSIYAYVKLQFCGFKKAYTQTQNSRDTWLGAGKNQEDGAYDMIHRNPLRGPPSTPKLIRHGLLSSSEHLSTETQPSRERSDGSNPTQNTPVISESEIRSPEPAVARPKPPWEALTFNTYPASLMPAEEDSPPPTTPTDPSRTTTPTKSAPSPTLNTLQALHLPRLSLRSLHRRPSPREPLTLTSFLSSEPDFNTAQLRKRRHATQHQVTLLFLYPLVYILMYTIPFIAHCRSRSLSHSDFHPSFPLSCATTISLALLPAVNCLVFALRERPWQRIPGSRRDLPDSFRFWAHRPGGRRDPLTRVPLAPDDDDDAAAVLERRFRLGLLRKGDPGTEVALQARGRYLRSDSDRGRRLLFVRKSLGEGGERSWWEVEGAWKGDSGLLGEGEEEEEDGEEEEEEDREGEEDEV